MHLLFESETDDAKVPKLKDLFDFADPGGPGNTEQNFYEVFCFSFLRLHREWYSRTSVAYMDFPDALQDTTKRMQEILLSSSVDMEKIVASNVATNLSFNGSIQDV